MLKNQNNHFKQEISNRGFIITKIDELIAVIDSKDYEPVLQIDGRKVGTAVARKRAPRGMGT